ncbi:MAG: nucleotide-diphospho-sugar transferase [Bacteroidales bacterium]|nr:nucleotide-diphospho-sugar transferase [Bacteroidales bacterium]
MVKGNPFHTDSLKTPILFLVFNRPEATKLVFETIRLAKPERIYIASDGPRAIKAGESEIVTEVRELVLSNIDWPCEVFTLFRNQNLGCKYAVSGALDWFFENEEMGIIVEDDVLPDNSFFNYCEELLLTYEDHHDIMMISGNSYPSIEITGPFSYYFSKYSNIWGWATWKRAWKLYDRELVNWPQKRETDFLLVKGNSYPDFVRYWKKMMDKTYHGKINTWDYQWQFSIWLNNGICILPQVNLVSNIGFDENGTHTNDSQDFTRHIKQNSMKFPLNHPDHLLINENADRWHELNILHTDPTLKQRIKYQITKYLKKWRFN